jgi:hypothetical protein
MIGVVWLGVSRLSVLHDVQRMAIAANCSARDIFSSASKNTPVNSTKPVDYRIGRRRRGTVDPDQVSMLELRNRDRMEATEGGA